MLKVLTKLTTKILVVAIVAMAPVAAQAEWGNLKAKFVVKGDAPKPAKLNVAKEPFCLKHAETLVDESLLVSKDGGLQNVVVSLLTVGKSDKIPVHESYADAAKGKVELDNKDCRFAPHILALRTSQTLVVKNSDPMGHNSNISLFNNNSANPLVPAGGSVSLNFTKSESRPMPVSCSIHPWMQGHLVIKEDPYVGISAADGTLEIQNLPAGELTFQIWHERPAYVTSATVGGKAVEWKKGKATFKVEAGKTTDLGDIVLKIEQLKQK